MNTIRFARIGLAVTALIPLSLGSALGAQASTTVSTTASSTTSSNFTPTAGQELAALKAKCHSAVADRQTALSTDTGRINSSALLTSVDRSALLGIASNDATGLATLDKTILADTTPAQTRTDCEKIVNDYRVYVLFEPQMHLVTSADAISAADAKLSILVQELKQKLGGTSNHAVQTALADLMTQVAAAQASAGGVSAAVLPLTPSGYPGNRATLETAHQSLLAARQDLAHARTDIDTIRDALKSAAATPSA